MEEFSVSQVSGRQKNVRLFQACQRLFKTILRLIRKVWKSNKDCPKHVKRNLNEFYARLDGFEEVLNKSRREICNKSRSLEHVTVTKKNVLASLKEVSGT